MKKYEKYINSKVDWIGQIPIHWEIIRIKHLFKEINERSFDGSEDLLSVSQYTGVTNKTERLEEGVMLTNASTLEGYKKVSKNDLVSNIMLAWNGSLGFSPFDGITSPAYSIYRLKTNDINRYFHYLLRTELYKSEFKRNSSGVIESRLRLYTDDFFRIESILPPIEEQNIIANFLDDKTAKIEQAIILKQKQIELLKERRQILIHKAVTRGLNENVKLKDSGVEWIGEIPEHWEIVSKMKFISSMKARQGWQGLKVNEYTDEGPYVLSSAHYNNHIIDWSKCPRVSIKRYLMDENIQLKIGDILLMKDGANMGKLAFVESLPGLACLNSHLLLFRPIKKNEKPMYFQKFMFYHMMCQKFQDYVKINGTGATFLGISQESLGNYQISLPPLSEQKEIVKFIENTTNKIAIAISLKEQEIEKLKEYKMSLIDGVVTGKIKIS
ncbi:restriction endonuclease subunit S [Flavobacterium sp.]|uniref:restriction endonuclease subunit S n=1 Tax=Flavobacterium sp. TaxID=239 RepID=UPI0031CE0621